MATGVKAITVRNRLSALRTVFRWIAANGHAPMPNFPRLPAGQYEKFVPPTQEELAVILAVAREHIVRVVILGAQLGVRVGSCELLRLTWDDVDMQSRVLRVHGAKKNANAQGREVPFRRASFLSLPNGESGIWTRGLPTSSIITVSLSRASRGHGVQRFSGQVSPGRYAPTICAMRLERKWWLRELMWAQWQSSWAISPPPCC